MKNNKKTLFILSIAFKVLRILLYIGIIFYYAIYHETSGYKELLIIAIAAIGLIIDIYIAGPKIFLRNKKNFQNKNNREE